MKEMLSCWNSRGNSFKFDNIAFDIHYYHDFSAIWRLLPHYRHIEVVAEHARELKLLPGSVVGEWSLSRPGHFSEEEKADFAQKQVVAYNHASHGWFFWNWHDHAFYPDWDLEKGVFGSGKLPCPLRQEELQGFLFPAWEGSGPVTRPLAQAERELMRLKESLTKDTSQFPAMARKHSECKSALQPGQMAGDLGWISKGSLGDQAMEDVVLALEVNELSDLVTTARGAHLATSSLGHPAKLQLGFGRRQTDGQYALLVVQHSWMFDGFNMNQSIERGADEATSGWAMPWLKSLLLAPATDPANGCTLSVADQPASTSAGGGGVDRVRNHPTPSEITGNGFSALPAQHDNNIVRRWKEVTHSDNRGSYEHEFLQEGKSKSCVEKTLCRLDITGCETWFADLCSLNRP
ncbi:PARV12.8 [Symbiodinium necroappetens]|uniref:peptidylprolyl isomerase n=1 Tax=Symbiodinium necroappetens TaxID=1628268 RepID=A0A812ZT69_9DINO|nr:PARV12.8 [Symbiodinium necroappetens]